MHLLWHAMNNHSMLNRSFFLVETEPRFVSSSVTNANATIEAKALDGRKKLIFCKIYSEKILFIYSYWSTVRLVTPLFVSVCQPSSYSEQIRGYILLDHSVYIRYRFHVDYSIWSQRFFNTIKLFISLSIA